MMALRSRRPSDLARVVAWIPDAAALYLFTGPRLAWPVTAAQLVALEQTPGMTAWTLVDTSLPGDAVGQVDITLSGTTAHLGRVIVDPGRRGEGLGTVLARLALDKAWELGAMRVKLNVISGNMPAIRTYEGLGFVADSAGAGARADLLSMAADRPRGA